MNDKPKRRGRPPREMRESSVASSEEIIQPEEDVVENFTQEEIQHSDPVPDADAPIVESFANDESPIEEKIHQLVEDASIPFVQGWENNMRVAPIDGRRIMVSETGLGQGALVYWRISKIVDKKNLRYIPKGRWTDFLSKKDIEFKPHYWKPYNPEEYWPLTV